MKYLILILLVVGWGWYLYNLWETNSDIKNAKKDLNSTNNIDKPEIKLEKKDEVTENTELEKKDNIASYKVNKLDNKNYIEIDDLTEKVEKISEKIKITWKVLNENVDKIIVKFKNKTSDFSNNTFELWQFKKWNEIFEYNADSKVFRNLDYWINEYIIEAYIWTEVSIVELEINIPDNLWENKKSEEKLSENISYNKKLIWDLFIGLPESELFGKALSIWEWKITYSNINDFEIIKDNFDKTDLTSDNMWNAEWEWYLNKNISWYVYWNTFREIDYSNKEGWVSFYVLRKSSDKFIYEKMYFDFNNNLKGILKIKQFDIIWEKSISEEMSELNNGLKEQNSDFEEVKKTDKLFKEIVR